MNEATIPQETFSRATFVRGYLGLLAEALEGPQGAGSAFLDRGGGLLPTLEALSSEEASTPPAPGMNTVAAHVEHTRFHLAGTRAFASGNPQRLDWAQSWQLQQVDEAGWAALKQALRDEYGAFRALAEGTPTWDENALGGALAALAHVAYHLGAMRQAVRLVREQNVGKL